MTLRHYDTMTLNRGDDDCGVRVDVDVDWTKVNDDEGNLYKFKASAERLDRVLQAVSEKLKMPKDAILLKYQDDDGDDIVLSG